MAYAVFEYYVANGTLCDEKCNIRVDLLVIIPLLAVATLTALRPPGHQVAANLYTILVILGLTALMAGLDGYYIYASAWRGCDRGWRSRIRLADETKPSLSYADLAHQSSADMPHEPQYGLRRG